MYFGETEIVKYTATLPTVLSKLYVLCIFVSAKVNG